MNSCLKVCCSAVFILAGITSAQAAESTAMPEDWRQSPPVMSSQDDSKPEQKAQPRKIRDLLQMQRSGSHATSHKKYISGAEKARAYQRYLDSFTHPIPEQFADTGFAAE